MSGGFFCRPFSFQFLIAMRQHKFTLEEHEFRDAKIAALLAQFNTPELA